MYLDNVDDLLALDSAHMLKHVDAQPEHYEDAWAFAKTLPLPDSLGQVRQVIVAGLGGLAIGGELMALFAADSASIPIQVVRGYALPAYAQGQDTLVIVSSYSGNTEETLALYETAHERGCQIVGITTGGTLAEWCRANGHPLWQFADTIGQPRAALGWSLGLMLNLASRLGWVTITDAEFADAVENLRKYRGRYRVDSLAKDNPAKRQAGQYLGRIPVVVGCGVFEGVARRWKGQLNENAKFWAMYDALPEMNHNSIVGILFPKEQMTKLSVVFITSREHDHARVALRHSLTFKLLLQHGIMVDKFRPRGKTLLAQMLHAIFYGDYVSFYAALANGIDPTTVAAIDELKNALANPPEPDKEPS